LAAGVFGVTFAAVFAAAAPAAERAPRLALRRSGRVRGRLLRTSRSPSAMTTSFLKRQFAGAEAFCTERNLKRTRAFHVVQTWEKDPFWAPRIFDYTK
jgi:hypothetical protein